MQVSEMILFIRNDKGAETNMLLTYKDFMDKWVFPFAENNGEIAKMTEEIFSSRRKENEWQEWYGTGNKSYYARFCSGINELQCFLLGTHNDSKEWGFDEAESSRECLEALKTRNMRTDGSSYGLNYHYEKAEKEFEQGEILHNFNGTDYRVVEKYSKNNLLLMNESNGNFLVGINTVFYCRTPMNENIIEEAEYGIEWGHGVYLSSTPSEIDFVGLRTEYCEPYRQKGSTFSIEIREVLSKVEDIPADTLGDAIDRAMEMYKHSEVVLDEQDYKGVAYIPVSKNSR